MEFSRQEYRLGGNFYLQGIFLTQGLNPGLLHWQADSLLSGPPEKLRGLYSVISTVVLPTAVITSNNSKPWEHKNTWC